MTMGCIAGMAWPSSRLEKVPQILKVSGVIRYSEAASGFGA